MMYNSQTSGFTELPHTADWAVRVWAPDFPKLLIEASRAMYALTDTQLTLEPRLKHRLTRIEGDVESLLIAFLSELLYLSEQQGLGFDCFDLTVEKDSLTGILEGAPIASQSREIKAVTYHNLAIRKTGKGLETTIVFDV